MKHITIILIMLLLSAPAFAYDSDGSFHIYSLGNSSCGEVVEEYQKDSWGKLNNSIWVGGYLTAINQHVNNGIGDIAKGADPSARDLWIYNYCQDNPLDNLKDAAYSLYRALQKK